MADISTVERVHRQLCDNERNDLADQGPPTTEECFYQ